MSPGGWGDGLWGEMPWGNVGGFNERVAVAPALAAQISHAKINRPRPADPPLVDYRLVLASRASSGLGTPIVDDVLTIGTPMDTDFAGRWSRTINAAGTLEFQLPMDDPIVREDIFTPGQRELHLYRDEKTGIGEELVWAGRLWIADVRWPWVRFMGMGFYEDFRHREISEDFYRFDAEQLQIAWEMLAYTQAEADGDVGVTLDSAASSGLNRTVEYCAEARQNIAQAIEDLASADDGFDFEVTPTKAWKTWFPQRGTDKTGSVILDGETSISDLAYTVDATQVENDVAGIGKKGDCEPILFKRYEDTTSRARYGLMQGTIERSDVRQDDDLIGALARERLALQSFSRKQPTVRFWNELNGPSPLRGDFDIGDAITIKASRGFATFDAPYRVLSYAVTFDHLGHETVDLTLDSLGQGSTTSVYHQSISAKTKVGVARGEYIEGPGGWGAGEWGASPWGGYQA